MTPQNYAQQMAEAQKAIDKFFESGAPRLVGELAVSHFKENFRKGGFVNNGLEKWKPTRRQGTAAGAAGQRGPLLSSNDNLYRSLAYRPSVRKVTISTPVSYAAVHNDGGTVHPTVTPKMRKFAWRKYYEAGGGNSGQEDPPQATPWKHTLSAVFMKHTTSSQREKTALSKPPSIRIEATSDLN